MMNTRQAIQYKKRTTLLKLTNSPFTFPDKCTLRFKLVTHACEFVLESTLLGIGGSTSEEMGNM